MNQDFKKTLKNSMVNALGISEKDVSITSVMMSALRGQRPDVSVSYTITADKMDERIISDLLGSIMIDNQKVALSNNGFKDISTSSPIISAVSISSSRISPMNSNKFDSLKRKLYYGNSNRRNVKGTSLTFIIVFGIICFLGVLIQFCLYNRKQLHEDKLLLVDKRPSLKNSEHQLPLFID